MKRWHYIGMDCHCQSTNIFCVSETGRRSMDWVGPTAIPQLVEAIKKVGRPRALTFEEGPLADWLLRNLAEHVDDIVVCEPRHNALIAKGGDKDDAIDSRKLAELLRGGFLKSVHHNSTFERTVFKQTLGLYHHAVRHRVREANRVMGYLRRWGVFVNEVSFVDQDRRLEEVLKRLPNDQTLLKNLGSLFAIYDTAVKQEGRMRTTLLKLARQEEVIRRWTKLPGISWIRGATFFVYLDTPWRFRNKSKLWRYMGIGLKRRTSGSGAAVVRVSQQANHHLKDAILGAANSAIRTKDNPFADQFRRWREEEGQSFLNARRNVARSMAVTLWGIWKNSSGYRPEWVGLSLKEILQLSH